MYRLLMIGIIVFTLSGCAVTAQQVPSPTTRSTPEYAIEQATTTKTDGTTATIPVPSPQPTSTMDTAVAFSTKRAAFAAAWKQSNQGGAEATALLYFGPNDKSGPPLALWRNVLDGSEQPTKVADWKNGVFEISGPRLSADKQWIAYGAPVGDWPYNLHVVRVDGSDDRIVTQVGIHNPCYPEFAWSEIESKLAYRIDTGVLRVYNPHTRDNRRLVTFTKAKFVGWDAQNRVLMAVKHNNGQPRNIVAVDSNTGEYITLATLPSAERLFCRRISPKGNHLLFTLHRTSYHLDLTTRQFTLVDTPALRTLWSNDEHAFLTFTGKADNVVSVVPLLQNAEVPNAKTVLNPPTKPGIFGVLSISPDGQWLVGCHVLSYPDIHSYLYHLESGTWHLLAEGSRCIDVVGWTTR